MTTNLKEKIRKEMKTFIAEALNPYGPNEYEIDEMKLENKELLSTKCTVDSLENIQAYFEGHNIDCKHHLYATEKELCKSILNSTIKKNYCFIDKR